MAHKLPDGCTVTWIAAHPHTGRVGCWRVCVGSQAPAYTATQAAGVALAYAMYTTTRTGIKVKRAAQTRVEFRGVVTPQGHWQGGV